MLKVRDIRTLHFNASLVTLSACDTGVGPVGEDGVANIVNAFIEAGADSVVSTLWEIEDHSTEHLMAEFYRRLARGESKGDALRDAQRRTHEGRILAILLGQFRAGRRSQRHDLTLQRLPMPLTRSDREQLLQKIDRSVREKFYDPHFNGRNWEAIVRQHREPVIDADTDTAFEAAVADMLKELGSSGLGLLGPHTAITPRSSINASFRAVPTNGDGTRWVFQDVLPGGVAERAAIKPGDALIAIAGSEIAPPNAPAFEMGRKTEITISRKGQRQVVQIDLATQKPKYRSNPYSEPKSVAASLIDGSIANLKISLFPGHGRDRFRKRGDRRI